MGRNSVLDLSNVAGDIRVTGATRDAIDVDVVVRVRDGDGRGRAPQWRDLGVEMTQVGSRVEIRTRLSRRASTSIEFTVAVPDDAAVTIKSMSGTIAVTGVSGDVRLESVSGDVDVARAPNLSEVKTVSGQVTAREISGDSVLTLGSVSGSVIATGLHVRALTAGSISGDLHLTSVVAQRVQGKSVSGNVEFTGPLAAGGRFEFATHSGDVRLRLPPGSSFDLAADTSSGSLHSDFPVALRSSRTGGSSKAIRGVVGDAAATVVTARSFSGSVTLSRQ